MAFNFLTKYRSAFSIFKKKCAPVQQQNYSSYIQLYQELSSFESRLSQLQVKKMPKKLQDFSKRLRRLYREDNEQSVYSVPLEITHTSEYFIRKGDEMLFGNEQQENQTTLDQLLSLTRNMAHSSLQSYLEQLLPIVNQKVSLFQAIQLRFINIEERLCRLLFKKYTSFSRTSNQLSFLSQRQYKGDFKFQLVDDLALIESASECLYHCALFNQLRSKLIIACQLAVTTLSQRLSQEALSRLIYCLAVAGRPMRVVENNFLKFSEKLIDYPLQLLFYMTVSEIQDTFTLTTILNTFKAEPKNAQQYLIFKIISKMIKQRYNLTLQLPEHQQTVKQKHGGQLFFQNFLERYQYKYSNIPNELMYHEIYRIEDKHFICLDHRLVNIQTMKLNGLGLIYQQYFAKKELNFKHINWPRMLPMDKRTLRDQYVLSKFKGIQRPKIVKKRFYQ